MRLATVSTQALCFAQYITSHVVHFPALFRCEKNHISRTVLRHFCDCPLKLHRQASQKISYRVPPTCRVISCHDVTEHRAVLQTGNWLKAFTTFSCAIQCAVIWCVPFRVPFGVPFRVCHSVCLSNHYSRVVDQKRQLSLTNHRVNRNKILQWIGKSRLQPVNLRHYFTCMFGNFFGIFYKIFLLSRIGKSIHDEPDSGFIRFCRQFVHVEGSSSAGVQERRIPP